MKILLVINQLHCGGAEQQLITMCEGLHKRNHECEVISIYNLLELRDRLDRIQVPITVAHKYSKIDVTVVSRLHSLIKKANPELVHAFLAASCLFTGMTKWIGTSIPILHSERDVNTWKSRWRVRLDNIVRARVAKITCNAETIKTHLIEVEHVPAEKIVVIPNGLAPERRTRPDNKAIESARREIGAPFGGFIVISVANFTPKKQHQVLLKAFAQAKKQINNLFLVMVGKGPLEEDIRKSIEQLGLTESSRMICNCINPLAFLCASDAAILTSYVEGCSNALLEAMAVGLPIVATDAGGNRELVTHGLGGFICPVNDFSALANGLVRLRQESDLSHQMGLHNANRVRREFTDDIMVERSLALYEEVRRKRSQGGC